MNQKLLKFLTKPQIPRKTPVKPPSFTKSSKPSEKELPKPSSKLDIPVVIPLIHPLEHSNDHMENPNELIITQGKELEESPIKTADRNYESMLNVSESLENTIKGRAFNSSSYNNNSHVGGYSPLKLHSRRNSKEVANKEANNMNNPHMGVNSPLKLLSRRNSKETGNQGVTKEANSSNTGSFLSQDSKNKGDRKLGSKKQRFLKTKNHKIEQKAPSDTAIPINSPEKLNTNAKPNSLLAEVIEKNSEIEEKHEAGPDPKNRFFMSNKPQEPGYPSQIRSLAPKFYHHFTSQRIFAEKSFAQQSERNRTAAINSSSSRRKKSPSTSIPRSLSPKVLKSGSKKLPKLEVFDFYISVLRSLEQIKFNINLQKNDEKRDPGWEYIVNFEEISVEEKEKDIFEVLSAKFGKPFFFVLKRIFLIYAIKRSDVLSLSQRALMKFARDFDFFKKIRNLSPTDLQLLFSRLGKSPGCSLRQFIEILFKISKVAEPLKSNEHPSLKPVRSQEHDNGFKRFIEEYLVPCYKRIALTSLEANVDNVQVFYKGQNPYENPAVQLLFQNDELIKHVFSLYETYDIRRSGFSFVYLKDFLRFCREYALIPYLCNCHQVVKIFMIFKDAQAETITFMDFVTLLCCIAHIGAGKPEEAAKNKGFYGKLHYLMGKLALSNNKVAEKLVLSRIL